MMIKGKILSEGLAIGSIFKVKEFKYEFNPIVIERSLCDLEIQKFKNAQTEVKLQLEKLILKEEESPETAEIFEGHLGIVIDDEFTFEVIETIKGGLSSDASVYKVFSPQIAAFKKKEDPYMVERAGDLEDIRDRLIKNILNFETDNEVQNKDVIIFVKELTSSQTAQLDLSKVKGIVVNICGKSSHAAIMARNLSIPLLLINEPVDNMENEKNVLLDCLNGTINETPSLSEIDLFYAKLETRKSRQKYLRTLKDIPAKTTDGHLIRLFANIGKLDDLKQVKEYGAEGIGLFRTEFLFMEKKSAPSEESQFRIYKNVAESMGGKPVIIRTFDFGGDKKIPYLNLPYEENPFLGQRSARLYQKEYKLFATQIRAIVRASAFGNIKVMYPLISSVSELQKIIKLVEKAIFCLSVEDKKNYKKIEKGIMIETPSSALLADHLIKYCDFFSVGSNDLTQYTIAVDRGNPNIVDLFDPFIPSVMHLISITADSAHKNGKWVGLCGELASDINGALILVGWGIDELSISAPMIPQVKEALCKVSYANLQELAASILHFETSEQILDYINTFRRKYDV